MISRSLLQADFRRNNQSTRFACLWFRIQEECISGQRESPRGNKVKWQMQLAWQQIENNQTWFNKWFGLYSSLKAELFQNIVLPYIPVSRFGLGGLE